jgi:hypothetical protein
MKRVNERSLYRYVLLSLLLLGCPFASNAQTSRTLGAIPDEAKSELLSSSIASNCVRTVRADVVALSKAIMLNRLGASIPNAFMFALRADTTGTGNHIQLRPGKRPRPIVLRANVGDCLEITFTNAIPPDAFKEFPPGADRPSLPQVGTQEISLHIQGQEWTTGPQDDGSFVGNNSSSLASPSPAPTPGPGPPQTQVYKLLVRNEGTFLLYTMGDTAAEPVGQLSRGLFGALNVQPKGAEWYRSQITAQELAWATKKNQSGHPIRTPQGQPVIDYNAKYPDSTMRPAGTPILKMLDANLNIVHSDLTAIITGPNAGRFPGTTGINKAEPPCNAEEGGSGAGDPLFCTNPSSPDRKQPYREVTIIYHEVGQIATQAFPVFTDPQMANTVNAGFDGFAINYGTGGIGAEVYANRIGVGPMGGCVDCKFEEFFLSAWAVGDPAMLVDRPANSSLATPSVLCTAAQLGDTGAPNPSCASARTPTTGFPYKLGGLLKATKACFADDPSNVYHSYINDHTKFRIHHGGTIATHVHHQHAHQWLASPNSDQGAYLDSQMISPGASYTLEMTFNGSGNRNKVVGDSIFHCHFYPHFAAGMWAMWRTHDTFEAGTELDANGIPTPESRALPDGEIQAGTPNPALVPMPTLPMAPMPSPVFIKNGQIVFGTPATPDPTGANVTVNPGFPYFIPGIAGMRAPHPPLDFAPDGAGGVMDGGLPRHVTTGGTIGYEKHDQFDWSKDFGSLTARQLPEGGTNVEKVAMKFFGVRCRNTFMPDGTAGNCPPPNSTAPQMTQSRPTGFVLNGLPLGPQMGAPFADPGVDDNGKPINFNPNTHTQAKRVYKAAAIQLNVTFNQQRWHFPQQRILTLWDDVKPTLEFSLGGSGRPPEPLFFRGNSGDIVEYWHTNLIPNYYVVDDFQVRTPTDILGQHIHLVKFDVTASDGGGNGFNYEDGAFSPDEVRERIRALNASGGSWTPCAGCPTATLAPKPPPAEICGGPNSPSQCTSEWLGAQTTIQRWYLDPVVDSQNVDRTLRTAFTHDQFGAFTHTQVGLYGGLLVEPKASSWTSNDGAIVFGSRPDGGPTSWQARIITSNPGHSYREFALEFQDLQLAYTAASRTAPDPARDRGWRDQDQAINPIFFPEFGEVRPKLISTGNTYPIAGIQSVNYRNEPIALRVVNSADLSYAFDNLSALAANSNFSNPDPLTPLMRAYENDNVQIRAVAAGHMFSHQFNLMGPTWFAEPSWKSSGYRSSQPMGVSEHFEFVLKVPPSSAPIAATSARTPRACPDEMSDGNCVDYLYSPSLDETGIAHGLWGIFRAYAPNKVAQRLQPLPNNPVGPGVKVNYSTCPANLSDKQRRVFNITAVTAQKALVNISSIAGSDTLVGEILFNSRAPGISNPMGVLYVRTEDLDSNGALKPRVSVEPLLLRANAGDCIQINLTNNLDPSATVFSHKFSWPPPFNPRFLMSTMSHLVGLHPQLLSYDAYTSYGMNVGWNRKGQEDQLAPFGQTVKYQWYAGKIERNAQGDLIHTPIEFGSLNLFPSDLLFQNPNGLFGGMIIEPQGSKWSCGDPENLSSCDPGAGSSSRSRTSATVTLADNTQFREFALMISDATISQSDERVWTSSVTNYRTEPWSLRYAGNFTQNFSCMLSNQLVQYSQKDPQTPVFTAKAGDSVRFRLMHPFGTGDSQVFTLHGHAWQRNPYKNNSSVIGDNKLSQWIGSRDNHGSSDHFDFMLSSAGGQGRVSGDYLFTVFLPDQALRGVWGLLRVGGTNVAEPAKPNGSCEQISAPANAPSRPRVNLLERFRRKP